MEFFAVTPISTDPYGIMKKLDHIIKNYDSRFRCFVDQINPNASKEEKKNIKNALSGAITTHQIAKIVRHYVELIKKYIKIMITPDRETAKNLLSKKILWPEKIIISSIVSAVSEFCQAPIDLYCFLCNRFRRLSISNSHARPVGHP